MQFLLDLSLLARVIRHPRLEGGEKTLLHGFIETENAEASFHVSNDHCALHPVCSESSCWTAW